MNGQLNAAIVLQFRNRFATDCIDCILMGYDKMRSERIYDVNSVEDNLTVHLVRNMEEGGYLEAKDIIVDVQHKLYNRDVSYGPGDPANTPVIDLKFGKVWSKKDYRFYVEAKNLSEKNWTKTTGASVRSYDSRSYYISDGIERFLSGYYPEGCLIGYVVNGTTSGVVSNLNRLITKRGSGPRIGTLEPDVSIAQGSCFLSDNQLSHRTLTLRHLMLQLA